MSAPFSFFPRNEGKSDSHVFALFLFVPVYLHPRYHNQGLATSCLQALIHSYMVPVLHATRIRATVLVGNMGSRRAQEKNGFREIGRFWTEIGENRGGGTKECWVMEWRADCEEA